MTFAAVRVVEDKRFQRDLCGVVIDKTRRKDRREVVFRSPVAQ